MTLVRALFFAAGLIILGYEAALRLDIPGVELIGYAVGVVLLARTSRRTAMIGIGLPDELVDVAAHRVYRQSHERIIAKMKAQQLGEDCAMNVTKQDLLDCLKDHPKAKEAIYWWCVAWHSGEGSDLYTILCDESLGYEPDPNDNVVKPDLENPGRIHTIPRWYADPEIHTLFDKLGEAFGPILQKTVDGEPEPYRPVRLRDVKEGQVLIAGTGFHCITHRWPCRVIRKHGTLGVTCSERFHGIVLTPESDLYFHPLTENSEGFVEGFRR